MTNKPRICRCCAREILDSRGNPTLEATVVLDDGTVGVASAPSGASVGSNEAHELRDADRGRYHGLGVLDAVSNVCRVISPELVGMCATEQYEIDRVLCELDGTEDKGVLGANAILAVSLACARASANYYRTPIYKYLGGIDTYRMPVPMLNVLGGGAHSSNSLDIQEYMLVPVGARSFADALRMGSEIYHNLGNILKERGLCASVGDEGAYAPDLDGEEQALGLIVEAIERSTYSTSDVKIALDAASSAWYSSESGEYTTLKGKRHFTHEGLIEYYAHLADSYPICSIEDGLAEGDLEGWQMLTERLGGKMMLVGDDLFVTDSARLCDGAEMGIANAILIKPNQIGTLSETMRTVRAARDVGYSYILSHRSGETEDTTVCDIAVALSAPFVKLGAPCRGERIAKYNRLLRIEGSAHGELEYGTGAPYRLIKNGENTRFN